MNETKIRTLIRNLALELAVYTALLVLYFFLVLQYLGDFLADLFVSQSVVYAILCLGLIVAQGVLLEAVTSFLLRLLRLDRSL